MMGNQQNYQDLVAKVNMYLDNELSKEAERDLLKELKQNPMYHEVLSKEQSFREFIKSKVQRKKVSPSLIQSIKEKIRVNPSWGGSIKRKPLNSRSFTFIILVVDQQLKVIGMPLKSVIYTTFADLKRNIKLC